MDWDRRFAAELLQFARDRGHHAYFMPVEADFAEFLKGIV